MKVRKGSNSQPVRSRLLFEMIPRGDAFCKHLPRGSDLALEPVFRCTSLRERQWGPAELISRRVIQAPLRLEISSEFTELVQAAGSAPGLAWVRHQCIPAERLHMQTGELALPVSRPIPADGRAAILCYDFIDCGRIQDDSYTQEAFSLPIFSFCGDIAARGRMDSRELRGRSSGGGGAGNGSRVRCPQE